MSGRDLLLAAPPGSGATAAYLIPMLGWLLRQQRLRSRNRAYPPALVLTPSRELAQQVGRRNPTACAGMQRSCSPMQPHASPCKAPVSTPVQTTAPSLS